MEPSYTESNSRSLSNIIVLFLGIVLYIPSLILIIKEVLKWIDQKISIVLSFKIDSYDMIMLLIELIFLIIIPLLITRWIVKGYQKRKNAQFVIGILLAVFWIGGWTFSIWNTYISEPVSFEPPVCKDGYGYTTMLGSNDILEYSRCRPGPNINKYPYVNF